MFKNKQILKEKLKLRQNVILLCKFIDSLSLSISENNCIYNFINNTKIIFKKIK